MKWSQLGTDRGEDAWELYHGGHVYQLVPSDEVPGLIVCMKDGFFEARFVDRSMALAKEYTEKFIVDAPAPLED